MATELRPGMVVAGKYRCEREIGRGAMGIVFAATHLALGQLVALKILHDASPDVAARFAREARLAARLKGAHVARVTDAGQLDTGEPFIAMELLEGKDLGAILRERGPLPVREACSYIVQPGEALAEAHALGMIHRDVKPANLFLANGVIKILDFGITKAAPSSAESINMRTDAGALLGTPPYMSPEQLMSSADVDVRSDVWSVGVVLYTLLASKPPFAGPSLAKIFRAVVEEPHPPLRRADVPAALVAIIDRCLRKRREERYPNLTELAAALAPFTGSHAPSSRSMRRPGMIVATMAVSMAVGALAVIQPWRSHATQTTPQPVRASASAPEVALGAPLFASPPEQPTSDADAAAEARTLPPSTTSRAIVSAPTSTATANPEGIRAAERKFTAYKPDCLAAWDELRATPGYTASFDTDRTHGECLMTSGRCAEGRSVLADAYRRPDARPRRSAADITIEVSSRATALCPDAQLTNEELAWKKRMRIGPELASNDIAKATADADALVTLLPTLPRGGYMKESSYVYTLERICDAYVAGARCDLAKRYCAQACTANRVGLDGCMPIKLGARCPYP